MRSVGLPSPSRRRESSHRRWDRVSAGEPASGRAGARPAFESDIPQMVQFKSEMIDRCYSEFAGPALEEWKERFCSDSYFRARVPLSTRGGENGINWFSLVTDETGIRAMSAIKLRDDVAYLGDFYVRDTGNGLGTKLFDDALETIQQEAERSGLRRIVCDVFSTNGLVYEACKRAGFRDAGGFEEKSLGVWVNRLELPISQLESPAECEQLSQ